VEGREEWVKRGMGRGGGDEWQYSLGEGRWW